MRVLVAPDKFAGTMTAAEAASAIAAGWRRARPTDEIVCLPLADGGPGFLDTIAAVRDGDLFPCLVSGSVAGRKVEADLLVLDEVNGDGVSGRFVYVESAQACGLHLVDSADRNPEVTTSAGVGDLLLEAVSLGANHIVIGLGGSGTNDGGAGMLARLGATAVDADGRDVTEQLLAGGGGLGAIAAVDMTEPLAVLESVQLVVASDVDIPLLGPGGASLGFGGQKGADESQRLSLEENLQAWSTAVGEMLAESPGSGAAGGLGFGLALLGAEFRSGATTVLDAVRFAEQSADVDVVITGEGRVDWQSLRGKLVGTVLELAATNGSTAMIMAGASEWDGGESPELRGAALHTIVGSGRTTVEAMAEPEMHLADLAESVAADWDGSR